MDASPEHFGESFGVVLVTVGTVGSGFAEGEAFSKVAYVTHWDNPGAIQGFINDGVIPAGKWVQRGRGSLGGYVLSGSPGKFPFGSKLVLKVAKSSLKPPKGWEMSKWLIGQRMLKHPLKF